MSNYGDLERAKDRYTALLKDILIGTWKSEIWTDDEGRSWDETFTFSKGRGGFFSDYNYKEGKSSNSGTLTWDIQDKDVLCELSTVFFGTVPYSLELCEVGGAFCLIRTTAKGQALRHWKQ